MKYRNYSNFVEKLSTISLLIVLCSCKGSTGNQGATGNVGTPGVNAQPCAVVPLANGADILCPDGSSQTITNGQIGPAGPQGPAGQNGTNGINGSNGSSVTWVQFCPGSPAYPYVFPEGGLCVDGNLYAVYSANDGFLTLITPGAYTSDGIGSSCNFTVLTNCQIQN